MRMFTSSMRFVIYLCFASVCFSLEVIEVEETEETVLETPNKSVPGSLNQLIALLDKENLTPPGLETEEYASSLLSQDVESVNDANDTAELRQIERDEVRTNIAKIIIAAQKKKQLLDTEHIKENITLKDLFPDANIRIGSNIMKQAPPPLLRQATSPTPGTMEPTTTTTTEPTTTTTENTADFPKTGDIELLVEDIVYSGHMIHWSVDQKYLAISDIW